MTEKEDEYTTGGGPTLLDQRAQGFDPSQLVACEKCLRPNAPTRTSCIYCGAQLTVNEASAGLRRPTLKPLEDWEQGANVVLLPCVGSDLSAETIGEACSLLRIQPDRLLEIVGSGVALPLARAATEDEAGLLVKRLRVIGLRTVSVTDESLGIPSQPPRRARTLDWGEDSLHLWTTLDSEPEEVALREIILLVVGRIFTKRVEIEEQRGRMTGRGEIVEAREIASDEMVLDIFPARADERFGWRIAADSFDYSCLGQGKSLLARENFLALASDLQRRATVARFDDGYRDVRHLLTSAWPLTERTGAHGLRRARGGRLNTEAVTVVTNENQFTRYSRLCWRLALSAAGR